MSETVKIQYACKQENPYQMWNSEYTGRMPECIIWEAEHMFSPSFLKRSEKDPSRIRVSSLLIPIVFYLVFGVLLIMLKSQTLSIAAYVLAALMGIYGIYEIVSYLRSPVIRKITESRLAIGLIMLLAGALLAFNPGILEKLLPFVWGISLLFGGFLKIQYAFDQLTLKVRKWWIMLILAVFSLLIGTLALTRPAFLGDNKEIVIGIFLIAEAVMDVVVFILINRALKKDEYRIRPGDPHSAPASEAGPAAPSSPASSDTVPEPENKEEE